MSEDQNEYFIVGEVMGAHGQEGAMRVRIMTEFPDRFNRGAQLFIEGQPYIVAAAQLSKGTAILRLTGVDTPEIASSFHGKHLEIPASGRKVLPAGRYYHHDIIGIEVFTDTGISLGKVSDILNTGSNDIYIVSNGDTETLIPAIRDVVKEINLEQKRLTIEVIEGLLN